MRHREHPNIKTKVKHSESKDAWNVVSKQYGTKYKIAKVPYLVLEDNELANTRYKAEALEHAMFISYCFSNPNKVQYD